MKRINKDVLKINYSLFKSDKKNIIFNFFIWLIIICLPIVIAYIINIVFNEIEEVNENRVYILGFILLFLVIAQSFFILLGGKIDTLMQFRIKQSLRKNVIINSISKNKIDTGKMIDLLVNDLPYFSQLLTVELDLIGKFIFFIVSSVLLFFIDFKIGIVLLILLIVINRLIYVLSEKMKSSHKFYRNVDISYSTYINSLIKNRESVLLVGKKENFISNLNKINKERIKSTVKYRVVEILINEFANLYNVLSIVLILLIAIPSMKNGTITIGELTYLISFSAYLSQYNGLLSELFCSIKYCENSLIHFSEVFNKEDVVFNLIKIHDESDDIDKLSIYNYEGANLKFDFNKPEIVVVYGDVGSGKSYFLNNFIEKIKIDFKNQIGVALQNPVFLNETVKENINFLDDLDNKDIEFYLDKVGLLYELKEKIENESLIGINGKMLSEGQRQRLAVVRAIIHAKKILVLDECTSLLDYENEKRLLNTIKDKNVFTIIATNKKSILNIADRVIHIKNKKVVYDGVVKNIEKIKNST